MSTQISGTTLSMINSLPEKCKEIGTSFFDCVEVNMKKFTNSNNDPDSITYGDFTNEFEKVSAECDKKFDLGKCLEDTTTK